MSNPVSQQTKTDFLLFMQHGWADHAKSIAGLGAQLVPDGVVVAPNLGWWRTWWRMEPLIETVERGAIAALAQYPDAPWRIVGHSMGGLIWLELLDRHRDWWPRVHSLVLIASPVGGADLGRILDPLGWGVGIARDLGRNRRDLAARIAAQIPTLVIAGDIDGGSDGTVLVQTTGCDFAQFVTLPYSHPALKNHPALIPVIRQFWANPAIAPPSEPGLIGDICDRLRQVPGMTDAHPRDAAKAAPVCDFSDGTTVKTWRNPWGVLHVFVVDAQGVCHYGGFVGVADRPGLEAVLAELQRLS